MNKEKNRSSFGQRFLDVNWLDAAGFKELVFLPAMLHTATDKWWGDMGHRPTPHEGIDLVAWRTSEGNIRFFNGAIRVPVMYDGRIKAIIPDFLGQSVFISHPQFRQSEHTLFTIFGHLAPDIIYEPETLVREGDIIGTIAVPAGKPGAVRPHLHISAAWISDTMIPEALDWTVMGASDSVQLIDPLPLTGLPFSILESVG